jgi:hypothetical protein
MLAHNANDFIGAAPGGGSEIQNVRSAALIFVRRPDRTAARSDAALIAVGFEGGRKNY